jgi:uncharacterized protein
MKTSSIVLFVASALMPLALSAQDQVSGGAAPFEYREAKLPNYLSGHRWGKQGSPLTQMQQPVLPEESMKHMVVPEGFEVRLFAAEPDIRPPLAMAWDERGRLWLCESVDYPNEHQEPGKGRDTIRICEDTDGDGLADKFTVFADQLSICTSIAFSNGGVIVHQAPDTLFLKDTDGDDRADIRQVLFSGWSLSDTHAGPSNLRYGLDNHLWGMVGYSGFDGEIDGEQEKFRTGFYRFRPDTSGFEFLRSNNNNNWGLGFSEEGLVFGSTANRNPSVFLAIPNRYYERVRGWSGGTLTGIADSFLFNPISDRVRQVDHHGGYTAAAGHALYTARTYPREYWNRTAFVTGPTGKLIGNFTLRRDGAGFTARNNSNLFASVDEWTAPINAEVGPDGQVWFIDWYNYIVQHNPTPVAHERGKGNAYVSDLRDKLHGRVYRVVYKGREHARKMSLEGASLSTLVRTLSHDNMLWRLHAQRLLVEQGNDEAKDGLLDLIDDQNADSLGLNTAAIHALWTLEGLGLVNEADSLVMDTIVGALSHPSAGVRRNALMILPKSQAAIASIIGSNALRDENAQVRLSALLALADSPADAAVARAMAQFLAAGRNGSDRWLREAASMAAAKNAGNFLKEALVGVKGDPPVGLTDVVQRVASHYAAGPESIEVAGLLRLTKNTNSDVLQAFLDGIVVGWDPSSKPRLTSGDRESLNNLITGVSLHAQDALLALAQKWEVSGLFRGSAESVRKQLRTQLTGNGQSDANRLSAAGRLIRLEDGEETINAILGVIDLATPVDLAVGLIRELGQSRSNDVVSGLTEAWERFTPATRRSAVNVMLMRFEWTMSMLSAIGKGDIPKSELSASEWQQLIYSKNTTIQLRAGNMGIGAGNPDREAVFQAKLSALERQGNSARGKELFNLLCAQCHKLDDVGGAVGPELTGIGSRGREEILMEIVDPNRSLEANFRAWALETKDGRSLSGLLESEDQSSVQLLDASGQRHVVARREIASLTAGDLSLMPVGLVDDLNDANLAALIGFLSDSRAENH